MKIWALSEDLTQIQFSTKMGKKSQIARSIHKDRLYPKFEGKPSKGQNETLSPSQCFLHVTACPFHSATESGIAAISWNLVKIAFFKGNFGNCQVRNDEKIYMNLYQNQPNINVNSNIHFICSQNYDMGFSSGQF